MSICWKETYKRQTRSQGQKLKCALGGKRRVREAMVLNELSLEDKVKDKRKLILFHFVWSQENRNLIAVREPEAHGVRGCQAARLIPRVITF